MTSLLSTAAAVEDSSKSVPSSTIELEDLRGIFQRYQKRQSRDRNKLLVGTNVQVGVAGSEEEENNDTITSLASITCTSFDEEGWDDMMVGVGCDSTNDNIDESVDDDLSRISTGNKSVVSMSAASSYWTNNNEQHSTASSSFIFKHELLTPHVFAYQSWICGITEQEEDEDGEEDDERSSRSMMSIRWRTSLAPHRILQVASNSTGTVIAATTDQGIVSILRGSDGKVLATRLVNVIASEEGQGRMATQCEQAEEGGKGDDEISDGGINSFNDVTSAQISFVTSASSSSARTKSSDSLLVFSSDHNGPALLISNIQGQKLNDDRPNVVAQATKAMNLHTIQIPTVSHHDIYSMVAFSMTNNALDYGAETETTTILEEMRTFEIRFVFVHGNSIGEAKLGIAQYELAARKCTLIDQNVDFISTDGSSSKLKLNAAIKPLIRSVSSTYSSTADATDQYLLSFVASDENEIDVPMLCWMNPTNTQPSQGAILLGTTTLETSKSLGRSKCDAPTHSKIRVLAMTLVDSINPDTFAVSAVLLSNGRAEVQVLQCCVIRDHESSIIENYSAFSLGRTHTVYNIPIPMKISQSMKSISLTNIASKYYGPYSFRAKIDVGSNSPQQSFLFKTMNNAHDGSAIGNIRALSDIGDFKAARALVHSVGMEVLLQDKYANFHPAEIALQRLVRLLNHSGSQNAQLTSTSSICECLGIIERGVGHPEGQRVALEAFKAVLAWPGKDGTASIVQVATYSAEVLEILRRVSNDFNDEDVDPSVTMQYFYFVDALTDKVETISYIQSKLGTDASLPLSGDFSSVKSANDLFSCFIRNRLFDAAEDLMSSHLKPKLSSENLVSSMFQVSPACHPSLYGSLLKNIMLNDLSISHELLPVCLAWSCRMADDFDDIAGTEDGLDRAIYLLQTANQATKQLNLKVHSSFAHYSPFVDRRVELGETGTLQAKDLTNAETSGLDISISKDMTSSGPNTSIENGLTKKIRRCTSTALNDSETMERPTPTLLELSTMKRGAQKARQTGKFLSLQEEAFETSEGSVEMKLDSAHCLHLARSMGLGKNLVRLRDFTYHGGAQFVARELIRLFSSTANGEEREFHKKLEKDLLCFCEATKAGFDSALVSYAKELCQENTMTQQDVFFAASIARCCQKVKSKCEVTLTVLRAALSLHFSATWLAQLSKDALKWAAGDSSLRTELEEASRLLLIDEIIGRYCGDGAKQMFHVDNPLHALRLLDYIAGNVDHEMVQMDVFHLCEAFHHLSEEDGCTLLIQNAILQKNSTKAKDFLTVMYGRNQSLAHTVYGNAVTLCMDIIEDATSSIGTFDNLLVKNKSLSSFNKADIVDATQSARILTKIALANSSMFRVRGVNYDEERLRNLLHNLARAQALQNDHNIFISPTQLDNPQVVASITEKLLARVGNLYKQDQSNMVNGLVAETKRAITILADTRDFRETDLVFAASLSPACDLVRTTNDLEVFDFLSGLGVTVASENVFANRCCIRVAIELAMKALQAQEQVTANIEDTMKTLVTATSLLQDYVAARCSTKTISTLVTIMDTFDVIFRAMTRADEGIGENISSYRQSLLGKALAEKSPSFDFPLKTKDSDIDPGDLSTTRYLTLHPLWFIGDGLLLPPDATMNSSILYLKENIKGLQFSYDTQLMDSVREVASGRGAHSLSHQLLVHSSVITQCWNDEIDLETLDYCFSNEQLCVALSERYLGGTSNGITSGIVDAQLAVSFLLSLPLKLAFKVYRSSIPNAIKMRNFERAKVLANVGSAAGSSKGEHWSRQRKFVSQCDWLFIKASWWQLLEELEVAFDPQLFPESKDCCETSRSCGLDHDISTEISYAGSLVPSFIRRLSSRGDDIDDILECLQQFGDTFGLPQFFPVQCLIEHLLSPSHVAAPHNKNDESFTGSCIDSATSGGRSLENLVRGLLLQVGSPLQRIDILRRCIIRFEKSKPCNDYEKLSVLLGLYYADLSSFLSKDTEKNNESTKNLVQEVDIIDRRRDALAILSSFFRDDKKVDRPSFSDFFLPLPDIISKKATLSNTHLASCNILGWAAHDRNADEFDPLSPLETTLRSSCSPAVASALAPLCFALGVPRGFIRARALIARFEESKKQGAALPSFGEDVIPLLNKLISASDASELAEWCSGQYSLENVDKLESLDYALSQAVRASSEAEKKRADEQTISTALSRVKHLTVARDFLADRLEINNILESAEKSQAEDRASFSCLVRKLATKLDKFWESQSSFAPEDFVRRLLEEASMVAAEASLKEHGSISVGLLRKFSLMVHKISNSIASKYSHVQVGRLARQLTSAWLLNGDAKLSASDQNYDFDDTTPVMNTRNEEFDNEIVSEDDTLNFELDLSSLNTNDKRWNPKKNYDDENIVIDGMADNSEKRHQFTADEEPSSFRPTSARERSEFMSHRCSLRTAFILAFADGYFASSSSTDDDRSLKDTTNNKKESSSQRRGLLSKLKSSTRTKDQHETVLEHCRELLRIIFAKSSSASELAKVSGPFGDSLGLGPVVTTIHDQKTPETITFAMRHRCLRTAAILLPQPALEQVLAEEEFKPTYQSSNFVSLQACTFPAFVAKEVEEMGLSIPHSDLLQLSQMHFPSYARALWRHHRDKKESKGRLLLLILEMYLKETITDLRFYVGILKEILSLGKPRTLLLAIECTTRYSTKVGPEKRREFLESSVGVLPDSLHLLGSKFCSDMNEYLRGSDSTSESAKDNIYSTFFRVLHLFGAYLESRDVQKVWIGFLESLVAPNLAAAFQDEAERDHLIGAIYDSLERVKSNDLLIRETQDRLSTLFPNSARVVRIKNDTQDSSETASSSSPNEDPLASFFATQESNSNFFREN